MGDHKVSTIKSSAQRSQFIRHLLNDIKTLELMLEDDRIESGVTRIGVEQEFCLITDHWRPANNSTEILKAINDDHFTTEIARFNLEINLDPLRLESDCFSLVEKDLKDLLKKAAVTAKRYQTKIVLAGILPTISKKEVGLDYMTPSPRYEALNDSIRNLRDKDFELHIRGVDELSVVHDSVLFEACNTSFQMHLQIDPDDFVSSYNWAQAISAPVLGVCANSPLLLGRELWNETRIALFQQSIDTRTSSYALNDQLPRVMFGANWQSGSIAEIFKQDTARHEIIISRDIAGDSMQDFSNSITPTLEALNLHNGTVYRWNRPCYGVGGGKAHVRIENRYIPSGPTVIDEVANFAYWAGIMNGRTSDYDDMSSRMDFRDAKSNFYRAARTGKETVLRWMGEKISVSDLTTKYLLPMAYAGLKKAKVDQIDIERLLSIIEQRTAKRTGSQWMIDGFRKLSKDIKRDDALVEITRSMYANQQDNKPVHEWDLPTSDLKKDRTASTVGHIMSTELFWVNDSDIAELATSIMEWRKIHHLPVKNSDQKLIGLLTWKHMLDNKDGQTEHSGDQVKDIMVKDIITATADMTIVEAIGIMKEKDIGCLPVMDSGYLTGIVTVKDIIPYAND